jgi:PAS domain S-box-containing protein
MARPPHFLTGVERRFADHEIIVSKTDLRGIITYANDVFLRIAQYEEEEVLGKPHNMIRHPDMPRCVFKLLWDTIADGREIFAYVVNRAKSGDHYWVFAHVTPSFNEQGEIIGYHSNRRTPDRSALPQIQGVYQKLLAEEKKHSSPRDGMAAATRLLVEFLKQRKTTYEELMFAL